MRQIIFCCGLIAIGSGIYLTVKFSQDKPGSSIAHGVSTATEVGVRSNPFVETPGGEEETGIPGGDELPPIENPATLDDIFADPVPVGGSPLPNSPTSLTDPIVIEEPTLTKPEELQANDHVILQPIDGSSEPTPVFPPDTASPRAAMPYAVGASRQPVKVMPYATDKEPKTKPTRKMPYAEPDPSDKGASLPVSRLGSLVRVWDVAENDAAIRKIEPERRSKPLTLEQIHRAVFDLLPEADERNERAEKKPNKIDTMEFRITDYLYRQIWKRSF